QCSTARSKQKRRSWSSRRQAESVAGMSDNESSSNSSLSSQRPGRSLETSKKKSKLNLKAILAYHFRGKKFKAAAHRKFRSGSGKKKKKKEREGESTQKRKGRPPLRISPQERKRILQDRGLQFPFVEKYYGRKHLPLAMVLDYENAAIRGFFKYIKMLKFEEQLKQSLTALQASEDLEREPLMARKHKYLDDEGPISPIQE
ncbi:TATA box-binding protein-associated factor RNA polymerase I subunit D, partial [Tyto alba]